MALTLNLVVLPVVAGLIAGTGALATFMTDPGTVSPQQASSPCGAQTWPYIDGKCTKAEERRVRVVTAPRPSETPEGPAQAAPVIPHIAAPQPEPAAAPANLTTRDTVLRSPEIVAPPRKVVKREKRTEQRRDRRERQWTQSYTVPEEAFGRERAVIVVRPLRLESFR